MPMCPGDRIYSNTHYNVRTYVTGRVAKNQTQVTIALPQLSFTQAKVKSSQEITRVAKYLVKNAT